jgi:TrpR-related protein YerC/YecD
LNKDEDKLFKAIVTIKTVEECKKFFHDLCTPSEIEEFSSRWLIARLLSTKKSYREIASKTGVSTTTIGRVARFIKYVNNGYKLILERIK